MYMQTHICIFKMSVCCCQWTCFIFACYGCTCKFPSSSINYLLPHNQYVPFPKTIRSRPYVTLLSQKSINTAMSPYTNVFAQFFLLILSVMHLSLFSFLNLQLPPSSFVRTLLLLTPCRRKSSSSTSFAALFLFLTCLTQRHLLLPLLKKQHPQKAAFNRIHVRDLEQKHLPRTWMNKILQRKGDENTAWIVLLNIYNKMPFFILFFYGKHRSWELNVAVSIAVWTRARAKLLNALPKSTVKWDSALGFFCIGADCINQFITRVHITPLNQLGASRSQPTSFECFCLAVFQVVAILHKRMSHSLPLLRKSTSHSIWTFMVLP